MDEPIEMHIEVPIVVSGEEGVAREVDWNDTFEPTKLKGWQVAEYFASKNDTAEFAAPQEPPKIKPNAW